MKWLIGTQAPIVSHSYFIFVMMAVKNLLSKNLKRDATLTTYSTKHSWLIGHRNLHCICIWFEVRFPTAQNTDFYIDIIFLNISKIMNYIFHVSG